jgi:GntR family transcriptional regulator
VNGVVLDRGSPVPLWFQIAKQLEQAVDSGALAPGSRLDNEIELAEQLSVSRPTLRKAIERLVEQGLVVRRRGIGTIVMPRRVQRPIALSSLYEDLTASGQEPTTKVLSIRREPASPHVASVLGIAEGAPVTAIERLRLTGGEPLALMHNHLPAELLPDSGEALEIMGLYQLLRTRGCVIQLANQTIGARQATAREARLLGVPRSATLLTLQRTAYGTDGKAVEHGSHCYLADRYSFEMSLVAR